MTIMQNELGIRSMASITVIRDGKVREEIKDVGNTILDRFFTSFLVATPTVAALAAWSTDIKLGSNGAATLTTMNGIQTKLTHPAITATGRSTNRVSTLAIVNIAGEDFLEATMVDTFTFAKGAVVGTLRELGAALADKSTANGNTETRIVLPNDVLLTAEDTLVVNYTWKARIKATQSNVLTADFNGTPTQCTVTRVVHQTSIRSSSWSALGKILFPSYTTTLTPTAVVGDGAYSAGVQTGQVAGAVTNTLSWNSGTKTLTYTLAAAIGVLNTATNKITYLLIGTVNAVATSDIFAYTFSPQIPKANTDTLDLTIQTVINRL